MCTVSSYPHLAKYTRAAGIAVRGFFLLLIAGCARLSEVLVPGNLLVDLELIKTTHVGRGLCEAKIVVSNSWEWVLKSMIIQGTVYDENSTAIGQFVGSFGDILPGKRGVDQTIINVTCEDIATAIVSNASYSNKPSSRLLISNHKIDLTLTPVQ